MEARTGTRSLISPTLILDYEDAHSPSLLQETGRRPVAFWSSENLVVDVARALARPKSDFYHIALNDYNAFLLFLPMPFLTD
ncbi:hypothetical protein NL676_029792 [Syzygium grande]|nr:hypothetical protein NL676_029792 [Syzygium grande]